MKQYLAGEIFLKLKDLTFCTLVNLPSDRHWFRASPQIEWFDADHPDLLERVAKECSSL